MDENKFDPVQEFIALRDSLTRSLSKSLNLGGQLLRTFPLVDVYETANTIVVETEPMPGLVPTELVVAVENNILSIVGEIIPESTTGERQYIKRERHIGAFRRDVVLNHPVIATEAQASLKNGVLTVRLPKRISAS